MADEKVHPQTAKEEKQRESKGSRTIINKNSTTSNSSSGCGRKESKEATKGQKPQSLALSDSSSSGADKRKGAPAVSQQSAGTPPGGEGAGREEPKTIEQQTLREQLQKLVSHKLASGDLDHAGLLALEALSKLPAGPGSDQSAAAAPVAAGGAGIGLPRSRSALPPGIESLPKFSGKDPSHLTDILNRFHSLVIAALPGATPAQQNKALNRDVVFVLEGSALKFFNSLKAGQIDWEPIPPAAESQQGQEQQQAVKPPFRPPSTWAEVYEAFHDHFLPADGIARTSETLFSLSQAAGETVPSLAQRQLGLTHHLNRLIEAHGGQTTFWEAITIRLFERALRADLRRLQHAEPPCLTFQESVDRAERNASSLQSMAKQSKGANNGRRREGPADDGVVHANGSIFNHSNGAVHFKDTIEEEPRPPTHARASTPAANPKGPAAVFPARRDNTAAPGGNDSNGTAVRRQARPHPREASSTVKGEPTPAAHGDFLPQHAEGPYDNLDGGDLSHDEARSASAWEEPPDVRESGGRARRGGDGVGEDRPAAGKRYTKKPKNGQKRMRECGDDEHAGDGQHHQPFPPRHRPWPVDPDSVPPCRVQECKSINRQFHCSDDCYFHPEHAQRNRRKAQRRRRIPVHPALNNSVPGPSERFQNDFEYQGPARFNGGNFDGNHLY